MTNYFYTDTNGQKQWASEQHLQTLAAQGIVLPYTPLETEDGRTGLAGKMVPGLFTTASSPQTTQVPPVGQTRG